MTATVDVPTAASAAAVNVIDCGMPGVRVSVDGVAVTAVGRPDSEMLTVPLNPLMAVAEIEVCWPTPPVVTVKLAGDKLSE